MKVNHIDQPLQLGLFGGTFNPIHRGHHQAALEVLRQFNLDLIYFVPSALPPHKAKGTLATAEDRIEMVRRTLNGHPRLMVSDVELQRAGPSYTIDTLRYFKAGLPPKGRLFFILGMDAFLEINTWKSFVCLLEEADFIVMSRPQSGASLDSLETTVESFAKEQISQEYRFSSERHALVHPRYHTIHPVRVTPVDIASSRIRRMIRHGQEIAPWVAPDVNRYIEERGLYR